MSIKDRIIMVRKAQSPRMSQTEFGEKMGMSRGMINNLELGRVEPPESTIKLICMTYDINWSWLKDGEGEMKNPPDTIDEMVDRIMTGEESFKKSVFRAFARLGNDEWVALQKLYDSIKKECE